MSRVHPRRETSREEQEQDDWYGWVRGEGGRGGLTKERECPCPVSSCWAVSVSSTPGPRMRSGTGFAEVKGLA